MHAWESIQKTVVYIEDHIAEDIQIEKLAKIAALSEFYYQRLFSRLVKVPVREYIKLRRLARSCDMLRDKSNHIIDVAVEYGFECRETYTRAFKQTYRITPAQYREQIVELHHFDMPNLLLNYIMVDEGVPLITEGIVLEYNYKTLKEPIHFLGIKGYYYFKKGKMLGERPGISEPGLIWDKFHSLKNRIPCKKHGRLIGVSYHGDAPEGYSSYFVGAESTDNPTDTGFESWQMPARKYVVCSFEAEDTKKLFASLGKMMKFTRFWLREHGLTADGFFPEIYYPETRDIAYMEMWIPFKKRENNK